VRLAVGLFALVSVAAASELADAAKRGDRTAVKRLVSGGSDPGAAQVDGTTALHWAVHRDDLEMAAALIAAGAKVAVANRYGMTPLALSCTNGSAAMVKRLLEAGADPNAALPGGETALMTAARTGRVDTVKVLLAAGAKVDAADERQGQTALIWAASEGHVAVVQALIAAGADFKKRLVSGFTPFLFAARDGQIEIVRALLGAGANVNDTVQRPETGARGGSQGRGYPRIGTSALLLAVTNGHFELAAHLLDAGADPNAAETGLTSLHVISIVRKPGGGDNDPAPFGSGKLTSLDMIRKLVSKGANINARMTRKVNLGLTGLNTLGATPFLLACRSADAEMMRLLAELGADPLIPNADKATPLIVAAGLGTRSPGEDAGTEAEVMEAVELAIQLGNDPNAVDNNGETAMHGAAYKNLPGVVELLYKKGARADVWNQKNRFGWTPLLIAQGYRFGNFKPSHVTMDAFRKVMTDAGLSVPDPPRQDVLSNQEYRFPPRRTPPPQN